MATLENFGIALGPLRQKDWDLAKERDALQDHKAEGRIFCEEYGVRAIIQRPSYDKEGRRSTAPDPGGSGKGAKMRRRTHRGRRTRKIPRMLIGNVLCVLRSEIPEVWEDSWWRPSLLL
jgi:hypothetical protein